MPAPRNLHVNLVYKDDCLQRARKQVTPVVANVRYLQRLVLEFASKHMYITASGVREYARQQYGLELDLRRIHDSITRLVKRGFAEKVEYGLYRLTQLGKNALAVILNSSAKKTSKEVGSKAVVFGGFGGGFSVVFSRARLHVRGGGGLVDLVRQLYVLYRVVGCALGYLKVFIGRKRFYSVVRGVGVVCVDCFVGGHGAGVVGRGRSFKRPLISLDYFYSLGLVPREVGVDVMAVVAGLSRLGVKVYFG
jgi:predicted transcriptional regulator